jgi:hypothetical protein
MNRTDNLTLDWERIIETVREAEKAGEEEAVQYYRSQQPHLLERVLENITEPKVVRPRFDKPQAHDGLALAADDFDVDTLRKRYRSNPIDLTLTKVHVTIESDDQHIIFRFMGQLDLNGQPVTIYRDDDKSKQLVRQITGKDVRFSVTELDLRISQLGQVAFRLEIGGQHIEGSLKS